MLIVQLNVEWRHAFKCILLYRSWCFVMLLFRWTWMKRCLALQNASRGWKCRWGLMTSSCFYSFCFSWCTSLMQCCCLRRWFWADGYPHENAPIKMKYRRWLNYCVSLLQRRSVEINRCRWGSRPSPRVEMQPTSTWTLIEMLQLPISRADLICFNCSFANAHLVQLFNNLETSCVLQIVR